MYRFTRLILALTLLTSLLPAAFAGPALAQAEVPGELEFDRIAGPNRFATAAAVSAATYPTADVVFVAPGGTFAQALAGGPRAALDDAPLLLVEADRIPVETQQELDRLDPEQIVILGTTTDIGDGVAAALGAQAATRRVAGTDDITTAAAISADGFEPGVDTVYLATNADFPDALAGGVAAALGGNPVLLVEPDGIPGATAAEIARLTPNTIALLGGDAAVSDQAALQLAEITTAPVRRLAGPTRLETAIKTSGDRHHDGTTIDTVYLATSANFPDAMATAPAIASAGGALLLTPIDCMPLHVRDELARLAPQHVVALGGTAAISDDAAALTLCHQTPPPPAFTVAAAPSTESLEPTGDSGPRPIAVMTSEGGTQTRFVADELILSTDDTDVLDAVLDATDGTVLSTTPAFGARPTTHVVRVGSDVSSAMSPTAFGATLQWLDADATGQHALSSDAALATMMAATDARLDGISVGLNFVGESTGLIDRDITESAAAPTNNDPFVWNQFRLSGSPNIGTAEAWRLLAIAGRDSATVTVGIIDGGFGATNGDYPAGTTGADGMPNAMNCSGGNPCPWHGTDVAIAAAGVIDNNFGSAGSAGPVGALRLYRHTGGVDSMINRIQQAVNDGVDVINMSFSGEVDAVGTIFVDEGENATEAAHAAGVLVVAAAGNAGQDVDATDCFVVCWEEEWHWPCENNGVYCVGGLSSGSRGRHASSNFGVESCGNAFCQVEVFAPYTINVGTNPANTGDQIRAVNGTSGSSPNVAGIGALVIAANPNLSGGLVQTLLNQTALPSSSTTVGRVVNAHGAVLAALGDVPPFVQITSPADGEELYHGGFSTVPLEALTATTTGDSATLAWELERTATSQVTSLNPTQPLSLPAEGTYIVRVSATTGGLSATDEVTVQAVNAPPAAIISDPATDGEVFRQGIQVTLSGSGSDPNHPLGVPCSQLSWQLDGQQLATGCNPTVAFNTTGVHTLSLTVTDGDGGSDTESRQIQVDPAPASGPPDVSITQPASGAGLGGSNVAQLAADAVDPDGDPMTFEWTATYGSTTTVIGTTLNMSWTPDDDVPFNCGGQSVTLQLTASAVDGTGSDSVDVYVSQPPC